MCGVIPFPSRVVQGSEKAVPRRKRRAEVELPLCSASQPQYVVPVFAGWAEPLDGGMKPHHGLGHGFARVIAVKAAVELASLADQFREPGRIRPGASSGEAAILRVQ